MILRKNLLMFLILLFCIVLLITLFSGWSFFKKNNQTGAKVTISISDWPKENEPARTAQYKEFQKIMLEKYGIAVVGDEYQYAVNSFLPKAAGGKLPTMYKTWFTETQKIVENGYAADVTNIMKKAGWEKAMNPQLLPLVSKDGKVYGVVEDGYYQGLVCNIKLFKDAGLVDSNGIPKAPKTYDDLITVAKTIKDKTGAAGFIMETNNNCGGWHFMNIAWSFGVVFEKKVNGKWVASFNSPEGVAALNYIKDLKWKHKVLPDNNLLDWSSGQEVFATNQGAMFFFNGKYHGGFDFMINTYKISKDNIAIFSMPAGPKGRFSQLGGNVWMFAPNATNGQIEAAMKWLEITGYGPKMTEEAKAAEISNYKTDTEGKFVIGVNGLPVWSSKERIKLVEDLRKNNININPAMVSDYNDIRQVTLKSEEPVACQELYKALDKAIQLVLTDSNADVKAILDKTASDFQKDVLDKQ